MKMTVQCQGPRDGHDRTPRKKNAGDSAGTIGEDEDDSLVLRDGHDRMPSKRNVGDSAKSRGDPGTDYEHVVVK
ncbi:hypothetical protein RHGRI_029294 [Rhododendron griersonianum]|uniref:Uncharacterized protein n=1 Tax=Rhododendron griersonianum TaxID=479676 RepID=A0AAV6IL10_9ERIC|nr:hypothetical protein RHGRI_029294 [Rhododendron griersonianum]